MKIEILKRSNYFRYSMYELGFSQAQYNYVFKYLEFDKLRKDVLIQFNDRRIERWFNRKYIYDFSLDYIYKKSFLGYEYLKDNWGKGVFCLYINYPDKQELKTLVNRVINIRLIRGKQ